MTLKKMFKIFKKAYGRKEAKKHWNRYWENVKTIEENKDIIFMKIFNNCKER